MARTTINSLGIPADTIVSADLDYPLTDFSSTGIDDNATSTKLTVSDTGIDVTGTASADKILVNKEGADHIEIVDTSSGQVTNLATGNTVGYISVDPSNAVASSQFGVYVDGTEHMRIDSSGNVGIGTTSPDSILHLSGSSASKIIIENSASPRGNYIGINSSDNIVIAADEDNLGTSSSIQFRVDAAERMRIDDSGSVGIGTSSPNANAKFEVVSTSAGAVTNVIQLRNGDATAGSGAKLQFLNSTINYATAGTSEITGVRYSGNYSALTFSTSGNTGVVTERMRIDGDGKVGIGTTSPDRTLSIQGDSGTNIPLTVESGTGQTNCLTAFRDPNTTQPYKVAIGCEGDNLIARAGGSERMRIDAAGDVGIGTTSPAYRLDTQVSDSDWAARILNTRSTDGSGLLVRSDSTNDPLVLGVYGNGAYRMAVRGDGNVGIGTTSPLYELSQHVSDSGANYHQFTNSTTGTTSAAGFLVGIGGDEQATLWNYESTAIRFATSSTERMRINSSGNVGIGTTNPLEKLHVTSDDGRIVVQSANSNTAEAIMGGYVVYSGDGSGPGAGNRAGIQSFIIDSYGTKFDLRFYTSDGSTNFNEVGRFTEDGNLLVGTTSFSAGTNGFKISQSGRLTESSTNATTSKVHRAFYNPNGQVGNIATSGSATAYNTSSDQRLKENIVDAPAGNIDAIRVRSFDWKADGSHQTYGMVAQELVDVAPEAVSQGETEDDMWGVDYSKLVPMMIKEIQDLRARVAQLEGE